MINKQIHNYKLSKLIGEGGMAKVYEAEHIKLDTKVAIKILNPSLVANESIRSKFKNEARIIASLSHPNIVKVIDFEESVDTIAIIMEFLSGNNLSTLIKRTRNLNSDSILDIFAKILDAFNYAHSLGIIHRDIKPDNIIVTNEGVPKVLDFGIAMILESSGNTITESQIGTPVYMSPEQVVDSKDIDLRSDIYSLGVTLYFILSGKEPYDITKFSNFQILEKIVEDPLPQLKNISAELNSIIQKATNKDKTLRFANCEEFKQSLIKLKTEDQTLIDDPDSNKTFVDVLMKDNVSDFISPVNKKNKKGLIILLAIVLTFLCVSGYFGSEYFKKKWENDLYAAAENDKTGYQDYLKKYPTGKYVELAKQQIVKRSCFSKVISGDITEYPNDFIFTTDSTAITYKTFDYKDQGIWLIAIDKTGKVLWEKTYKSKESTKTGVLWKNICSATAIENNQFVFTAWSKTEKDSTYHVIKMNIDGDVIGENKIFFKDQIPNSLSISQSYPNFIQIRKSNFILCTKYSLGYKLGKCLLDLNSNFEVNKVINLDFMSNNNYIFKNGIILDTESKDVKINNYSTGYITSSYFYNEDGYKWRKTDTLGYANNLFYIEDKIITNLVSKPTNYNNNDNRTSFYFKQYNTTGTLLNKKLFSFNDYSKLLKFVPISKQEYVVCLESTELESDKKFKILVIDTSGTIKKENLIPYKEEYSAHINKIIVKNKFIYLFGVDKGPNNKDIWLVKLDFSLNVIWEKFYGGKNDESAKDFFITSNNEFVIIASTESKNVGSQDIWLFKTDENGNFLE